MFIAASADAQTPEVEFFERKIRPVLVENCYACHSAKLERPMGGLRLDSRDGVRQGGASGPAVIAGRPGQSLLLKALSYTDMNLKMPPTGKLPDRVIADLDQWIADGAADPRTGEVSESVAPPSKNEKSEKTGPGTSIEEGRHWWSFQPITKHPAPQTSRPDWQRKKIDAFVLAKLDENNLQPSPPADPRTLIRRAYFDLTGLPPTYEQVEGLCRRPVARRVRRPD